MTLDRAALARVQALYVRLLFCAPTVSAYRDDPGALLARHGLPEEAAALLPDVGSANFAAESRARRGNVEREIAARFPRTVEHLAAQGDAAPVAGFLSSDAFYDPGSGLPHPSGVGPGYENTSKFYFWLRGARGLRAPGCDIALRTHLNVEFAIYLLSTLAKGAEPYYRRFEGAVWWPNDPAAPVPVVVVDDRMRLIRVSEPAKIGQLTALHFANLDALDPDPSLIEGPL